MRLLGVITYYNQHKGYAFVRPLMKAAGETPVVVGDEAEREEACGGNGRPLGEFFFHRSQLENAPYRGVFVGAKVEFEPGDKGLVKQVRLCE
ncbi:MAG: hypothetical protein GF403_06625 [Candidatus Coatesbacteria bacterium]|nr:hypothetical protein [Candidatus Coatesbacteria bacterium]